MAKFSLLFSYLTLVILFGDTYVAKEAARPLKGAARPLVNKLEQRGEVCGVGT
jgi:hypothetical protein